MIATAAGAVVLAVWAGLALWTYAQRPQVSGTAQQWYRTSAPQVFVPVENAGNLTGLRASVDGSDASGKLRATGEGLALMLDDVADGEHAVHVKAHPSRVFGDHVDQRFTIRVDTQKPELAINRVPPGWRPISQISGRVEPGTKLALSFAGRSVAVHPVKGSFALAPELPDGRTTVRLVARDRAGNRSVVTRTIQVDRTPPRLHIDRVPAVVGTAHPTLRGTLDDASPVTVQAKLDGVSVALRAPDGKALLGGGVVKGRFSLPLARLHQGVHRLSITAIDSAGNTSIAEAGPFTVDSTEKLRASSVLGLGARGDDVVQLERRLKAFGTYKGPFTRYYNARTEAAVRAFQAKHELPVTGVATPQLLELSKERIVVHLKRFRVELIRDGKKVFSAPIAIGTASYPTPLGRFEITSKIKNPTWIPPNSPWAAGLEPVPPGVDNPLGTRWIGTSAPDIGFHATPQEFTVGTAASHGCMRMRRVDVERLYELVRVGTAVDIEV